MRYLYVKANVRYPEDADVNGIKDFNGKLMPFMNAGVWSPVIDLELGKILNWPEKTIADIFYKVCDEGEYFLRSNPDGPNEYQWSGDYVPNDFLCFGDSGYGDYIIMEINSDGTIKSYRRPDIDFKTEWKPLNNNKKEHL